MQQYCIDELISLFNGLFQDTEQTVLVAGGEEPIYLPASDERPMHQVVFAFGYFSSALHEISHWCVAGKERRKLEDYGYWYEPDGRSAEQQKAFEQVEVLPQALEWVFSVCAGIKFNISVDNLSGEVSDTQHIFKQNVYNKVLELLASGMNNRMQIFAEALLRQYRPGYQLSENDFSLAMI